jgi:hypothetical protein
MLPSVLLSFFGEVGFGGCVFEGEGRHCGWWWGKFGLWLWMIGWRWHAGSFFGLVGEVLNELEGNGKELIPWKGSSKCTSDGRV